MDKTEPPKELLIQSKNVDEAKGLDASSGNSFRSTIVEKFKKSRGYNLDKSFFAFVSGAYNLMISTGTLLAGIGPFMITFAKYSVFSLSPVYVNEYTISAALLLAQSVLETLISVPMSYYSTFYVEERHGFNKTTKLTFWSDILKSFLISNIIQIPVFLCIIRLVHWGGNLFYLYVWIFILAFSVVMISVYPNYIMPLFNEYTPLKESPLKQKINALAKQLNYPLKKIYEVDGSKRSSHSNAYLYGFFKDKRIVLFDTLFKKNDASKDSDEALDLTCTDEEVVAILAHELGHWNYSHTLKGFFIQQAVFLSLMRLFSEFVHNDALYHSFGYVKLESTGKYPVIVGLTLFFMLLSPLNNLIGLLANSLSRKFEYEADAFAVSLGKTQDLKTGLLKITISNLSSFEVDPWYHMFTHSHPTLVQRLSAMTKAEKKLK